MTFKSMELFKSIISNPMATGGYVFFIDYENTSRKPLFSVVVLNNKSNYAIDKDTLELVDNISLDVDKLDIIRNQWVSRFQINSAIESKRVQLESTVPKLYESELKCQFKELENRSAQAKRRLICFLIIVWSNFSFSMAYFLYINRDGIIRMLQ